MPQSVCAVNHALKSVMRKIPWAPGRRAPTPDAPATPRTPPPRTSSCPADADGHTVTGTETHDERTWPPMTGHGRTATDRPSSRDHHCANADATATRPDDACSDTRDAT